MKRLISILCLAALGSGAGGAAVATASPLPRAQLSQFACHRALDPPNRAVSVKATMRPVSGTRKLSLKFQLLEQDAGSATAQSVVRAGDLGVWLSPREATLGQRPGDVWKLVKTVYNLNAPASYRFRVTFRWLGAGGRVLSTVVQQTVRCAERELRPDLLVAKVAVSAIPGDARHDRYVALIANRGATGAGPFQVLFTPGSSGAAISRTIAFLAAGASLREVFTGPACDALSPPTVVADSTSRVDDSNRANNTLTVACPAAPAGASGPARASGAARINLTMKTEIHPQYTETHVTCTCGNEFVTRSTKGEIHVEICSACHPFYTGRQKLVDTGGRVERFQRRVAKGRRTARTTAAS